MLDIAQYDQINPPYRLLMGPGPVNADPRITRSMAAPLIGQFDPVMTDYMNQTMALYRDIFKTTNQQTFVIDGTARAGIEAVLMSTIRPNDKVLIPVFGRFGLLLCEIAKRCRAEIYTIEMPWGQVFSPDMIEDAIKKVKPRLLLCVQGDTSTTMLQPLDEIGQICRRHGVISYVDATASIIGNPLEVDKWQLDGVSVSLQKCFSGPPGVAPITLHDNMVELIQKRKCVESGIRRDDEVDGSDEMIYSNYFDLDMIMRYWGAERINHHTEATSMLFAARESARIVLQEGLDNAIARHQINGKAMLAGLQAMDLEIFGDVSHKMNNVVGVIKPKNIDDAQLRNLMLSDFAIEIGSSFGPLKGNVWRIGTMGYNARKDCVMQTLTAFEAVLNKLGHKTKYGEALQAAWNCYSADK
ncbi:(S)-ureidoglycine-glyoxylate aminotransferase [Orbus hercynius]|uniref:(S)-ureidoglycine-glyoxylate aminotransferase n=1 Tax=Orbus hercynius TaxID=593135 RepID=A0A495RJA8_9GAMM|nr:alanine--glyoxylate aminotransferase family protein [Orbus hercynius]RKS87459.1 (S)-ureidoglycine-glyoxylate aminotransferase [Orbus hercynius]